MAQYVTDFSKFDVSVGAPEGWTPVFTAGEVWSVVGDPAAIGGKMLSSYMDALGYEGLKYDSADSYDTEALIKVRVTELFTDTTTNRSMAGVFVRGSGGSGTMTMYIAMLTSSSTQTLLRLYKYVDGTQTNLDEVVFNYTSSDYVWIRINATGTAINAKAWLDGDTEPASWMVSNTDSAVSSSGWTGVYSFYSATIYYDAINVGTEGDTAQKIETMRATMDQVYGLKMLAVFHQYYGNASVKKATLDQRYGDAAAVRRVLDQLYGDAYPVRTICEQLYNLAEGLRATLVQPYSIAQEKLLATMDQAYNIQDRDALRAILDQLYVLAAGGAIVQRQDITVTACGVEITSFYNVFVEQDETLFNMVGELQLADVAEYNLCTAYETEVVINVDGTEYNFIVDGYPTDARAVGETVYVVPLASPSILLAAPHSSVDGSLYGLASEIVATLAAGCAVDWQLVDWVIPAGLLAGDGLPAMDIIKKIVTAAGGVVQTAPDGTIVCRPEYPVSVPQWDTVDPDYTLTDQDDFFSVVPSAGLRDGYNVFYLSNQQLAGDGVSMDIESISATENELRVYLLPWDESASVTMHHSGGSWVSMVYGGVAVDEITDQVEIVGGSGKTTKLSSGYVSHQYTYTDLGAIEIAEDGTVTTETAGNSLVQLTYSNRYHKYSAFDYNIEDVQFYPEVS